eukprot:757212-Hanusia_phi.AAC.2
MTEAVGEGRGVNVFMILCAYPWAIVSTIRGQSRNCQDEECFLEVEQDDIDVNLIVVLRVLCVVAAVVALALALALVLALALALALAACFLWTTSSSRSMDVYTKETMMEPTMMILGSRGGC